MQVNQQGYIHLVEWPLSWRSASVVARPTTSNADSPTISSTNSRISSFIFHYQYFGHGILQARATYRPMIINTHPGGSCKKSVCLAPGKIGVIFQELVRSIRQPNARLGMRQVASAVMGGIVMFTTLENTHCSSRFVVVRCSIVGLVSL